MVGGSRAAACKNNTNIVICKAKNDQNIHFMRIFVHFTRNFKEMVQIFLGFESNANPMLALSWAHRHNRYKMRTPIFSQYKFLSPQNGGFLRASFVVPDSYKRENFTRLREVRYFFCLTKFTKRYKFETLNGKMVSKKIWTNKNWILVLSR